MTFWKLIRRNLRFHSRAHFGVVLGAAIGSAALIGALVVGDSVRQSLTEMALRRLGDIHFALATQDQLFQTSLGARVASVEPPALLAVNPTPTGNTSPGLPWPRSSALAVPGVVARQDGTARANHVTVLGVAPALWPHLAPWGFLSPGVQVRFEEKDSGTAAGPSAWQVNMHDGTTKVDFQGGNGVLSRWNAGETAFVNTTLARQLAARVGDEIIVRVVKPSALGLDAAISPRNDETLALRLKIGAILGPEMLGDFALTAQAAPPANLFLPEQFLAASLGVSNRANLLVIGQLDTPRHLTSWDKFREDAARQLMIHAPQRTINQPGKGLVGTYVDDSSWSVRLARAIEPKRENRIPDQLALAWLNTDLARAWLPEDAGLSIHAVEQPASATGGEVVPPCAEITSSRIFLDPAVVKAALTPRTSVLTNRARFEGDGPSDVAFARFVTNGVRVLTYLANLIQAGTNTTPYSMVTAADAPYVPADMQDDEILVNQWLADDLQVKPGDTVALSYYVVDSGSHLAERTNTFRVRQVVPLKGIYADRTLMPEFPGLAKAESTRDWDAGFPLIYKIRPKDEAYWNAHRGTPKAFVTLAAGQAMWANRFGTLTAIRYEVPAASSVSTYREAAYRNLLANLQPGDVGLHFEAVREQALKSANQAQDFGQLFLGFSFFLVVAALLLMALLFQFGLEQRTAELGILLALGLTPRQVRRLLLLEGVILAFLGGLLGVVGGIWYAKAMLWALTTVWRSAIGSAQLQFHVTATTLGIGLCASTVVATLTIWLTLRKQARQPARELLTGEIPSSKARGRSWGTWIALVSALSAAGMVGWALASGRHADAETFFSAGSLVLIAGLAAASAWLNRLARGALPRSRNVGMDMLHTLHDTSGTATSDAPCPLTPALSLGERERHRQRAGKSDTVGMLVDRTNGLPLPKGEGRGEGEEPVRTPAPQNLENSPPQHALRAEAGRSSGPSSSAGSGNAPLTLAALGVRGCARRRKRSVATIALLACGAFLIVSIGVFRLDANRDATRRDSGTGGFALIGESTMPIVKDLNTREGREFYGLDAKELAGVHFVALRVHEGDVANCLNLNRAIKPRLLGVRPELLTNRFTFTGVAKGLNRSDGWELLKSATAERLEGAPSDKSQIVNRESQISEVPGVGDANAIQWAMGKALGDTLDYTDEQGRPFKVRLVGAVANSILQGSLLIDEAEFTRRFPGESGYRMFLIDAPSNSVAEVSATLSRALQDAGLELTPAAERLNEFNAVQNTYLGTFQILGGLGLLLGSAGLGVVVLRNVLERRGELGLLTAVGFRRRRLQRLVLSEHVVLLAAGLAIGVLAAAVAVLPSILVPGMQLPYGSLAVTLAAVLLNGLLWSWLATNYALRGNLLAALRNE